jgi:hypothetical protein
MYRRSLIGGAAAAGLVLGAGRVAATASGVLPPSTSRWCSRCSATALAGIRRASPIRPPCTGPFITLTWRMARPSMPCAPRRPRRRSVPFTTCSRLAPSVEAMRHRPPCSTNTGTWPFLSRSSSVATHPDWRVPWTPMCSKATCSGSPGQSTGSASITTHQRRCRKPHSLHVSRRAR